MNDLDVEPKICDLARQAKLVQNLMADYLDQLNPPDDSDVELIYLSITTMHKMAQDLKAEYYRAHEAA